MALDNGDKEVEKVRCVEVADNLSERVKGSRVRVGEDAANLTLETGLGVNLAGSLSCEVTCDGVNVGLESCLDGGDGAGYLSGESRVDIGHVSVVSAAIELLIASSAASAVMFTKELCIGIVEP